MSRNKILYLTYDGLLEPLGYTQVLKYLEGLSRNFTISVVSFEKPIHLRNTKNVERIQKILRNKGIKWIVHKYHQKPQIPSTIYDLLILTFTLFYQRIFFNYNVLHLRGYVLGIPLVLLNWLLNFKIIFDIRGFWVDEKVDRDNWSKESYKYKFMKFIERILFRKALKIVTLTEMSKNIIKEQHNINPETILVIRTCAEKVKTFKRIDNKKLNFGYLGSTGRAYNFEETLKFFKIMKQNFDVGKLFIFSGDERSEIEEMIAACDLSSESYEINFAERKDIAYAFKKFDCLLFNLKVNFSISASMPTKIGESLSANVPVLCNNFNEDILEISAFNNACKIINFNNPNPQEVKDFLLNDSLDERCQNTYRKFFTLEDGVEKYKQIYKDV